MILLALFCSADAGIDLSICDGDGSSSNYTYLDGSGSTVSEGDVNYEWTVLNSVGDEWEILSVPDTRIEFGRFLRAERQYKAI